MLMRSTKIVKAVQVLPRKCTLNTHHCQDTPEAGLSPCIKSNSLLENTFELKPTNFMFMQNKKEPNKRENFVLSYEIPAIQCQCLK